MAEKKLSVKTAEFVRNLNIVTAVGKVALGVLVPPTAVIMYPWAALDVVTAGGAHVAGKHLEKKLPR